MMKNILFLLSRFPGIGGIEKITSLLSSELVSRYGVLICSHVQELEEKLLAELDSRVRFVRLPNAHAYGDANNTAFLLNLIEENHVDIMVYQDSYFRNDYLVEAVAKETQVRIVVVEHNSPNHPDLSLFSYFRDNVWYKNLYATFKTLFFYALSVHRDKKRRTRLYQAADRYVLLSKSLMQPFHRFSHVTADDKLAVIGNPMSYRRAEENGPKKMKQILFVAQLVRRKGVLKLLSVWKCLEAQFPDWKLTIVGDGELMPAVREFIRCHELQHVDLAGFASPVTPYYETAQIFCLCSSFEGYPMVLPEAMCSGVIPVAFDSFPALRDIVDDGENGFVIPAFDERAYAEKLSLLMEDEQLRKKMRAAALMKSRQFEIEPVISQWTALFESL